LAAQLDGRPALEVFAEALDPRVVLEIDTYWAAVGGADVPPLLERLGERVQLVHLKDGDLSEDPAAQLPLGTGAMPLAETLLAAPARAPRRARAAGPHQGRRPVRGPRRPAPPRHRCDAPGRDTAGRRRRRLRRDRVRRLRRGHVRGHRGLDRPSALRALTPRPGPPDRPCPRHRTPRRTPP